MELPNGPFIYNVKVERVIDGDTFDCTIDLGFNTFKREHIRLLDVDTPETYRPSTEAERTHGEAATAFVEEWINGHDLLLNSEKFGKYRWTGAFYRPDGKGGYESLADALIANDLIKRESY